MLVKFGVQSRPSWLLRGQRGFLNEGLSQPSLQLEGMGKEQRDQGLGLCFSNLLLFPQPVLNGTSGFICWSRGFLEVGGAGSRAELLEFLKAYSSQGGNPPLLLFPEETTTNGRVGLLRFRWDGPVGGGPVCSAVGRVHLTWLTSFFPPPPPPVRGHSPSWTQFNQWPFKFRGLLSLW